MPIIQVKASEVASKVPTASDLTVAEIAINLTDKKLYSKTSGGSIVEIGGAGASVNFVSDLGLITETALVNPPLAASTAYTNGTGLTLTGSTFAIDTAVVTTLTGTQTLTNKTISGASNTLTNIGNSSLTNSSITVNGSAISLGGSATITASTTNALTIGTGLSGTSFNGGTAVTIAIDSTVATLTGTQTLTNKTLTLPTIGGTGAKFNGSTSGTTTVLASAAAGTTTITLPATTGTVVTTGDSGTVTNTMLAGSIANNKLVNSSITVNGSAISLGGSATITASTTNALTIGTGLSGTSFNGGTAVTIAIDSTVATLTGSQTLTNKTFNLANNTLTTTLAQLNTAISDDNLVGSSSLATVATTGSYADLIATPNLATVATSGSYNDLTGKPTLATVATTGSYNDLTSKPTIISIVDVATATGDIHGIVDRTASTLSFTDATRTLTITPVSTSWDFYYKGTLTTVSSAKSIQLANTSGARFIRINPSTLVLEDAGAVPDFFNDVVIAYVYYDTTAAKAIIVGDERHGSKRDTTWHSNQHLNVGTVWRSGGALSYTLNNASAITLEVGAPLAIADEDLLHTITHSASPSADFQQILTGAASLEVVYLSGTTYTSTAQSTTPWVAGTSLARYNQITAGSGSLADATEGSYITYWLLATNDIRRPVKLVMGREVHASLDAAYAESFTEYGLSFAEQVFMYQIVLQTSSSYANTPKVVIAGVRKVTSKLATNSVLTLPATSHNNLTGRDVTDGHPISAITGLQTALDGKQKLITVGTTAPTSPSVGDLWVDTN